MASSKEYLNFILEQLDDLENIKYRAMMGEYILYYNDKITEVDDKEYLTGLFMTMLAELPARKVKK